MLYRVSGALFALFGALQIFGHLAGGNEPRIGESGFSSGQYGGLITGIALSIAGIYLLTYRRKEQK